MKNLRMKLGLALGALLMTTTPAAAALTITANTGIAAARTAFGGTTVLDWDIAGGPGSVTAAAGSSVAIANWIDGTGFEGLDLALSGNESFTWTFAAPVSRIGFALSTGTGLFPSEVRPTGAVFNIVTGGGDSGVLTLATGPGFTTWIEISSATPFSSISFTDTTDIWDQYFGDVYSPAVPEPASWAMMLLGLGIAGGAMRRRQRVGFSFG
jgi:PEP-CTERM motif